FFRESLFAAHKGGHFVLLYDARSPVFVRQGRAGAPAMGLWPLLAGLAPATPARPPARRDDSAGGRRAA
ncbi:MAG: hypothetical protein KDE24_37675, partial [Caldilinea sp.]|nr:hypothetical protein [Caldilinea sp.]